MNTTGRLVVGLAMVVGAAGCGGGVKKYSVSGTVKRDGKPLEWKSEGGHLLVIFIPENREKDRNVYRADTDRETGTYRIAAIPAGKYVVAIQQFDERHNDALGHAYNPGATTWEQEVSKDGEVIDIDLPRVIPRRENPR